MSTNNILKSDLPKLHDFIQSSMLVYPKEIIIATLRDFFSNDSYYHYSKDQFGFANTVDHTNLVPGAGINDNLTTRVFIGENYRYSGIYYPAILVKSGGGRYVPISINRDQGSVQYESVIFEDGYGHQKIINRPKSFITAGAWEGQIVIDIYARSLRARDDLAELVLLCFTEVNFDTLVDVGVIIKPISWSGPSESDDRNDKLFRQSLTLDIRTEWRREIPVKNLIDTILFTMYFQDIGTENSVPAANLTINTHETLTETLINI